MLKYKKEYNDFSLYSLVIYLVFNLPLTEKKNIAITTAKNITIPIKISDDVFIFFENL